MTIIALNLQKSKSNTISKVQKMMESPGNPVVKDSALPLLRFRFDCYFWELPRDSGGPKKKKKITENDEADSWNKLSPHLIRQGPKDN